MTRRSHQALSAAVAGACLTLCACGTGSAPAAAGSASARARAAAAGSAATRRFCNDASSFMRHIPAGPATAHTTIAQARTGLRTVLRSTVRGFSALKSEAPGNLVQPLTQIVAVYRSDENAAQTSGSLARISAAMVKENLSASAAFQRLLLFISINCK